MKVFNQAATLRALSFLLSLSNWKKLIVVGLLYGGGI